jgi:hypothetical protein
MDRVDTLDLSPQGGDAQGLPEGIAELSLGLSPGQPSELGRRSVIHREDALVEDGPAELMGVLPDQPLVGALASRRIQDGTTNVQVAPADSIDFTAPALGKPFLSV